MVPPQILPQKRKRNQRDVTFTSAHLTQNSTDSMTGGKIDVRGEFERMFTTGRSVGQKHEKFGVFGGLNSAQAL